MIYAGAYYQGKFFRKGKGYIMGENEGRKRREWVKNAAIVFLVIMLLLTFFSNTIMNYSLPEVATQYVQSGTITAKVRGTGNVEANDPYNVIVKESRVIESVAVKQGDQVEKDQVIYYLENKESDELKKAEDELEELELSYMKGLFGGTVSPEIINKVASGRTDSFASYQAMVTDIQNRLEAAEARVKECQNVLDNLNLQSTVNTNNATVSTAADELAKIQATADLASAQAAFNAYKERRVAEVSAQIAEVKKQVEDLRELVSKAETLAEGNTGTGSGGSTTSSVDSLKERKKETAEKLSKKIEEIVTAAKKAISFKQGVVDGKYTETIDGVKKWLSDYPDEEPNYATLMSDYNVLYAEDKIAGDLLNEAINSLSGYSAYQASLSQKEAELNALENKLAEINAITVNSNEDVKNATNRLAQAEKNINEITSANKETSVSYQNQIANAEAALKNAQAVYELLKTEQTELAADINAELDLSKINKDIAEKKEEIARLKESSMGTAITAPVAGTITSLAYVAGETTKPEEAAVVIQVEGKGYTLKISVTNEQAKKVQVGDTAELQNAWYYDDVQAILSSIKPDPDNPGQKKLLEFEVTGSSIQAGQALNISVGQRSSEYELVVPNSAVREDNNGKFILIVESKSGPLSNRYIATRVDVEVLASDDNNTAISAGLYGYEYVITTSTKPVEAGKQVRLNE